MPKQTPAALPDTLAARCQDISKRVYRALGCRGMVRIDYRLNGDDVYLLEVNTLPGLLGQSAMVQQILAAGYDLGEVFESLMLDVLNTRQPT